MIDAVFVEVRGLNLQRFLNKLIEKNVYVENINLKRKTLRFYISQNDLDSLEKVCKIELKKFKIVEQNKFIRFLNGLTRQIGSVLAFIIIFSYMFSISGRINKINLTYESTTFYDLSKVKAVLDENQITYGSKIDLSSLEIQRIIMLNVDDVSGCLVKFSGNNLNIVIYPSVEKENKKNDIVSDFDALILNVETYVGNCLVKKNDVVKKGDILIKNDGGAKGKILAKVYFSDYVLFSKKQNYFEKTGNFIILKNVSIFNKNLTNYQKNIKFSTYLIENCDFFVTKNLFLPLKIENLKIYETELKTKNVSLSDVEENLKNEALEKTKKLVPTGTEFEKISYSVFEDENYIRLDCFIETMIDIAS